MSATHAIEAFGACPDGVTLCTAAIQQAIDACHQAGGGQVLCGPGAFLTGTLTMRSNVELHLTAGCRLLGSPRLADYTPLIADGFHHEIAPERSGIALIQAIDAYRFAITGLGTIDGGGLAFYENVDRPGKLEKPPTPRPRLGMFYRCRDFRLSDVTFVDSACWTLWLMQCQGARLHGLSISGNRRMRNVDGIDLDGCRDITVSDCRIDTEDDCLVVRAIQRLYDAPAICENVTVTNCLLKSGCQAVRIGCPGDGVIRNCTFSNLVIESANNGILCEHPHRYLPADSQGTADIANLHFSHVIIHCWRKPIAIIVEPGIALPQLANLSFTDFTIRSGDPCLVQGCPETVVRQLRFANLQIETSGDDAILCRYCQGVQLDRVELTNRATPGANPERDSL